MQKVCMRQREMFHPKETGGKCLRKYRQMGGRKMNVIKEANTCCSEISCVSIEYYVKQTSANWNVLFGKSDLNQCSSWEADERLKPF